LGQEFFVKAVKIADILGDQHMTILRAPVELLRVSKLLSFRFGSGYKP
jgi:hypothetical protein